MKKTIKIITLFLVIVVLLSSLCGCNSQNKNNFEENPKEENVLDYDQTNHAIKLSKILQGKAMQTLNPTVRSYVNKYKDFDYLASALSKRQNEKANNKFQLYDYQGVNIEWEDSNNNSSYIVYVADNLEFNNAFTYTTKSKSINSEIGIFIPDKTYYYKVVGAKSGESCIDSFIAKAPVRYISADKTKNMRDLGGWKTVDGKVVNYGLLYRGAALNEGPNHSYLSDDAKRVFDYLKIKGEIDLRGNDKGDSASERDEATWLKNKINSEYPILRDGLVYFAYEQMTNDTNRAKNNLPKIFKFLADENNYPVYFHCSVGADRTGTLAYIIGALLGVDYEHLMVDFELTSFTDLNLIGGIRQRASISENNGVYSFNEPFNDISHPLGYAHNLLMQKYSTYSTDLKKVMEKYLLDMGVKKADIDKFKTIMLEKN